MRLRPLQEGLGRFLRNRAPGPDETDALFGELDPSGSVPPGVGLSVYRNNRILGIVGELRRVFPRTRARVGADAFDACAKDFVYSDASGAEPLGDLGRAFPALARGTLGDEAGDLADLEWALEIAFFATDDEPLAAEDFVGLEALSPETIRLRLRSGASLLTPAHPVQRETWQGPEANLRLIAWRQDGAVRADEIEGELWPVLHGISLGHSLAEIASHPDVAGIPGRVEECLSLLLSRGWLAGHSFE